VESVVLWGGEFGRSPQDQANSGDGRRHNNQGYSMWMASGGVKGGLRYGGTDEIGETSVVGKLGTHELHATMLHLLDFDHTKLTYRYAGRDFRLTDVYGAVATGLIAPYSNWANRVAIARFVQDIPRSPADPTWQLLASIEQQLPRYGDYPVKLVWGMHDWCFRPECLHRFQKLLPNAQTQELTDVGHYVMEEAADEVLAVIRSQ